jgi:hypothetical protein
MNAIDQIEAQLRRSVAALNPSASAAAAKPRRRALEAFPRRLATRRPVTIATAALAATVVLVVGLLSSGSAVGPSPALAAVLQHLAQIAANGPSLVPGAGQYLNVDSISRSASFAGFADGKTCITYGIDHRQAWTAADGSGLLRDTSGTATFTSPGDRALCLSKAPKAEFSAGASNLWFADGCFQLGPTNDMQALSTDPRTLLRQMRKLDGGPQTAAEDFVHVGDFMRGTDARPALRAALYRAAALIPGVRLLGMVRDHLGRRGLGVALTHHGDSNELIFNPMTAALLGERSTGKAPGSSSWTVYLGSHVVRRVPYRSPVALTSPCHRSMGYVSNVPGGSVMMGRRVK